jgi:hypothetical protein
MGWLRLGARFPTSDPLASNEGWKAAAEHVESVPLALEDAGAPESYVIVNLDTPDERLPVISPDEVMKRNSTENGSLCAVPL